MSSTISLRPFTKANLTTRPVKFQGSDQKPSQEIWTSTSGTFQTTESPPLVVPYEAVQVEGSDRLVLYIDPEAVHPVTNSDQQVPLPQLLTLTSPAALSRQINTLPASKVDSVFYPVKTPERSMELSALERRSDKPDFHVFDEEWITKALQNKAKEPIPAQYAEKYRQMLGLNELKKTQASLNPFSLSELISGPKREKVIVMTHLNPCGSK